MKLALIGRDIGYTRSPEVHRAIACAIGEQVNFDVKDVSYDMFEVTVNGLLRDYDGFFVTKPYKTEIKKYIDCKTDGVVNVVRSRDRAAFNTDGIGFIRAIDRNFDGWRNNVKSAVILGAGGGAYAVAKQLTKLGKKVYVLDRTLVNSLKLCSALGAELYSNQNTELIVNCTPLGTYGEDVLRALCVLPDFEYAFDLVYTEDTPFLRRIRSEGGQTSNGRDMLVYQAIEGIKLLLRVDFDVEKIYDRVMTVLGDSL